MILFRIYHAVFILAALLCVYLLFHLSMAFGIIAALVGACVIVISFRYWERAFVSAFSIVMFGLFVAPVYLYYHVFYGSLLHYAASTNNVVLTKTLLFAGFDTEIKRASFKDSIAMTPLEWASREGAYDTASILMDAGASPVGGRSALAVAAQRGKAEIVKMLLDKGVNPNQMPKVGDAPIFWAVYGMGWREQKQAQCEITRMLIDAGADVNVRMQPNAFQKEHGITNTGTPLAEAKRAENGCVIELLMRSGAK